jgi:hypothetical protein
MLLHMAGHLCCQGIMSSRFLLALTGLALSIAGLMLWWLHVPLGSGPIEVSVAI